MTDRLRCSFCNKWESDVRKLIAGPAVFICDECVEVCVDIIADDPRLRRLQSDASSPQFPSSALRSGTQRMIACALCGELASDEAMLAIDDRGSLCGACADAVEDALVQGRGEA